MDRLCGLVVKVLGYKSRGLGSITGATRFSEKWWVRKGDHSASLRTNVVQRGGGGEIAAAG
jgi:hypothetical protein